MSNLATAIQHLLEENDARGKTPKNLVELAGQANIGPSLLTRLSQGQRCKTEVLAQILSHISTNIGEKQEVMAAHLRDEINRGGLNPSEFFIIPNRQKKSDNPLANAPIHLQETLTTLANESLANEDLQQILISLGDMVTKYHGRMGKTTKYPTARERTLKVAEDKNPPKRPQKKK
jgi:hypothetical protein